MHKAHDLSQTEVESLRQEHYNAEVVDINPVHEDLAILRVRPDGDALQFVPGQYTSLGLGFWEPRVPSTQDESLDRKQFGNLVKRAYSISCPLISGDGRLVRANSTAFVEFFILLVRHAQKRPPALTPRLFALSVGDRVFMSRQVHGHYTLDGIQPDNDVVFVATGTGEAPHNAMLGELLAAGHHGRIISVVCVRYGRDLAYLQRHRELERRFDNYRYLTLTTREPENLDSSVPNYVGKRYLQEYFSTGDFEADSQYEFDSQKTHVFLCGNPEMIGVPHHTHDPAKRYPKPKGMVETLEQRGFRLDLPHEPGNIHFEKYW